MLDNKKENKPHEVKLTIQNSIKFDPTVPISYNGNSFRIVGGNRYIPFLNKKDNLPNLLLEARLTSPTQNACISSIAQTVVGKGIKVQEVEKPNEDLLNFFKSVNNKGDNINDIFRDVLGGERTHGNQFIEIVRGSFYKKRFIKIYLRSMLFSRLNLPDDYTDPTHMVFSKQIAKSGYIPLPNDTLKIPLWSGNILDQKKVWHKNKDGTESTIIHFKNKVSGIEHYGLPASYAGLRYQIEEGKMSQFNIDNLDNNMILGGMLILKAAMTQEEAQAQAKEILLSHVGEGKTGRIAVLSSENGLSDVDFKPFNTSKEGSFLEREKIVQNKIIMANNYHGTLIGVEHQGSLGKGSGFVRSIYDTIDATLLNPLERRLMEKVTHPIIQIWSDWMGIKEVQDYKFHFETAMPYSFMGDLDPATFIKVKEARNLAGMDPVDDNSGEKYLSEMKSKTDVQAKPAAEEGADNN